MLQDPRFLPAGDQALVVELGDTIDPRINRRVHGLMDAIERAEVPGVFDLVPTYRSILVYYDPDADLYVRAAGQGQRTVSRS